MGQVPSDGGVSGPLLFCNVLDTNVLGFYDGPGAPVAGWTWPKGVAYLAHLDTIIFENVFLFRARPNGAGRVFLLPDTK